jgi:cathepsin L
LTILVLTSIIACASAAAIFDATLDNEWSLYQAKHSKNYASLEIATHRRLAWESNLNFIKKHNEEYAQGMHTFTVGMNAYGDMTNKEFVAQMNGFLSSTTLKSDSHTFVAPSNVQVPDAVDWRTQGYVTPIKDQAQCGSCWAFSAVGSLEGQHFKATNKLVSLSEQNLVDCSGKEGNQGCNGGLMDQAFTYIKKNNGIDTEASYPYKARDGKCQFKAADVGATDTGFTDIASGSESDLQSALATVGPISVAIDASHSSFQLYKDGVYTEKRCSPTQLDHGVLAVGYGTEGGKDFWIVKNSWGTSWGMDGYIQMARNNKNMCGIATSASYPLV